MVVYDAFQRIDAIVKVLLELMVATIGDIISVKLFKSNLIYIIKIKRIISFQIYKTVNQQIHRSNIKIRWTFFCILRNYITCNVFYSCSSFVSIHFHPSQSFFSYIFIHASRIHIFVHKYSQFVNTSLLIY